jgi:hypothetical protein
MGADLIVAESMGSDKTMHSTNERVEEEMQFVCSTPYFTSDQFGALWLYTVR